MKEQRKLIIKLIALFLPFILVLGLFIYCEPYDYLGVHNDNRGFSEPNPIPRVRSFLNHKKRTIIALGASRTAHLDLQKVNEYLGDEAGLANLAFGGASLKEQMEVFWFAAENRKLTEVYFDLSFYNFNANYVYDRVTPALKESEDFFMYFKNEDIQKQTKDNVKEVLFPKKEVAQVVPQQTAEEKEAAWQEYTKEVYGICSTYVFNQEGLESLIEIAKYCEKNDIKLTFVCPPLHRSIWEEVIEPLNLNQYVEKYKSELSYYAPVYDMEYFSLISIRDDQFRDGFHAIGEAQEEYLQCAFSGEGVNFRVWKDGDILYYAPEKA